MIAAPFARLRRLWFQRLFPSLHNPPPPTRPAWPALLAVLAPAVLLFFVRLDCPLLEPQEARHAELARQMVEQGSADAWLSPTLHGHPYHDKPPLFYWLIALAFRVFGPEDWAARLVPGVAGCLTVLGTWLWGRRILGERAGLAGALILCLSARFVYLGRMLNFDTLLALWTTTALAAGHVALTAERLRRGWWVIAGSACGLGVLTKGPVAVVLVVVPLALWKLMGPRAARVGVGGWLLFGAATVGVAAPWFVWMAARHDGFLHDFLWRHHVERFASPFDHAEPFWFYLPGLLVGMLPWTLLLPGIGRWLMKRDNPLEPQPPAAIGFLLLTAIWGLVFFSIAGCKRAVYLVPIFPPFALAIGSYIDAVLLRPGSEAAPRLARGATVVFSLGAGMFVAAVISGLLDQLPGYSLAALLAGAAVVASRVGRGSWQVCGAATFAVIFLALVAVMPSYHDRFALRDCLDDVECAKVPVACFPRSWDSVPFYLRRADVRAYSEEQREQLLADLTRQPRTLLVTRSGRTLDALIRDLPPDRVFQTQRRHGAVTLGWVIQKQSAACGLAGQR